MLQRLIAALLGLLGIAAAALGIASATAWRADDPLVATATAETSTLVTEPGVLEVAGDPVTVTVRAEGSPVVLAVGRDTDVSGWIGADPHELVTGLADWHDLALSTGTTEPTASPTAESTAEATDEPAAEPSPSASEAAEGSASTAADPTGSDMWITEVSGDGSATLEWTAPDSGRWSLLAVSLGETTPTLELSWPQEVTTPWLWPGVAVGVLLIAIAAIMAIRMRRAASGADWHDVSTGMIAVVTPTTGAADPSAGTSTATSGLPTVTGTVPLIDPTTGQPMTRRQIREAEAAAAAAASRRGRRGATGAIPVVTGATPAVTGPVPTPADAAPDSSAAAAGTSDADAPTSRAASTAAIPTAPESAAAGRSGDGSTGAPVASAATASGTAPTGTPEPDGPTTGESPQGQTSGRRSLLGRFRGAKDTPAPESTPELTPEPTGWTTPAASWTPTGPSSDSAPERPAGPSWSAVPPAARTSGPVPTPAPSSSPESAPAAGPVRATGPAPAAGPAPADTSEATTVEESEAAPRKGRGSRLPWRKPREESAPADPTSTGAPASATPPVDDDAAPAVPGVDEEDDSLTTTQRADSWRRMWGFPSDAEPGSTPPSGQDDKEEDR